MSHPVPPATAENAPARLRGLRGASFGAAVMLVVQYSLGMWANLYAHLPAADHGKGLLAALASAITGGPLGVSLHAILGLALLMAGASAVVRAILLRRPPWVAITLLALGALLVAAIDGARFVGDSSEGASFGMALAAGVATLCYVFVLFGATPSSA